MSDAAIQAKIAEMWLKNRPGVREKIRLLERAANKLEETRTIEAGLRAEAASAAHKLAGSLGMFGYMEATEIARRIEIDLDAPGLPQPEKLLKDVEALRSSLGDALAD